MEILSVLLQFAPVVVVFLLINPAKDDPWGKAIAFGIGLLASGIVTYVATQFFGMKVFSKSGSSSGEEAGFITLFAAAIGALFLIIGCLGKTVKRL